MRSEFFVNYFGSYSLPQYFQKPLAVKRDCSWRESRYIALGGGWLLGVELSDSDRDSARIIKPYEVVGHEV